MSSRKKRSPEEQARREKIRELLQSSGVSSMEDIQDLFKETMYAKDMTASDIEAHIRDIYGIEVSDTAVSRMILPVAKE